MQYFNFTRLISKYSTTFTALIPSNGSYDDNGDYVSGAETKKALTGAIIAMSESRVIRSEGVYTQQDRDLYMLEPLDSSLKGARIIYGGKEYRIGDELENSEFTGVWHYTLKYVSAFDEGGD